MGLNEFFIENEFENKGNYNNTIISNVNTTSYFQNIRIFGTYKGKTLKKLRKKIAETKKHL